MDITEFILYGTQVNPYYTKYTAMRKAAEWSYEKEWRLIILGLQENVVKVPIPTAIYLGCKIDSSQEQILVKIAKEKQMKIYRMKMCDTSFRIYPEEVKD